MVFIPILNYERLNVRRAEGFPRQVIALRDITLRTRFYILPTLHSWQQCIIQKCDHKIKVSMRFFAARSSTVENQLYVRLKELF